MENLLNSKVLKKLGLDDKNQWILYDDKARAFFEYLSENLDEGNILTQKELEQFEDLKATGKYLELGEALDEELKALESHFPGILALTDESQEIEDELKFLEQETAEREARIARMIESGKKQLREMEIIEKHSNELDYTEKTLTNECLKDAEDLSERQKKNQQKVLQLKQTYIQPQNPPILCYQMPLDQHFHKCTQFLGQTEVLMRRFNIKRSCSDIHENDVPDSSVLDMKKQIHEIEEAKLQEDLTIAGMNSIIQNIDNIRSRAKSDPHEMRLLIDDVEAENESMALSFEVILKEADLLVEQSVDHKLRNLFQEHFKEKNKRTLSRLETVKTAQGLMENVTMLCELLWIIMQLDLDRLKNRADNSEELANLAQDSTKRMRMMKVVASRDPVASLSRFFLKKLQDLLTESLPVNRNELTTIAACLQEYARFDEMMLKTIKQSVSQEFLSQFHDTMNEIDSQSDALRKFIFNGPTIRRPKLYDTKFAMEIHEKGQKKREVEKAYEIAKHNYKKNIVEPSESDKFFVMNKNLWIYFLAEPKRVLECVKAVQEKAAEKGSSSLRALNITLSRPT